MPSNFSPSGAGSPRNTSNSAGAAAPHGSVPPEIRLSLWSEGLAPHYSQVARALCTAPTLVKQSPNLPAQVGALLGLGGALGQAKGFLDSLHALRSSPEHSSLQGHLRVSQAATAASVASYIAKQGYSAQIADPLKTVHSVLSQVGDAERINILSVVVNCLGALRASVSLKDHAGVVFAEALRNQLPEVKDVPLRTKLEESLATALARMRRPSQALDIITSANAEGRALSVEALGEVFMAASLGERDETVVAHIEELARSRLKTDSIDDVCGWGERCLAVGRFDLAGLSSVRATEIGAASGSPARLRSEALEMALRVLKWDLRGVGEWPESFSSLPEDRVQVLARAVQLVLPLKRTAESDSISKALGDQLVQGAEAGAAPLSSAAESAVCRLVSWAKLTQHTTHAARIYAALPPIFAHEIPPEGAAPQELSSHIVCLWMRAVSESLRYSHSSDVAKLLMYRANGLLDQLDQTGQISKAEVRNLYQLGALLSASCGEFEALTSMIACAQARERRLQGSGGISGADVHALAEGVTLQAKVSIVGYHFARYLNERAVEVFPSVFDLRQESHSSQLTFC